LSTHPLPTAGGNHAAPGPGSRSGYWISAALAIILTIIPFWLVMSRALPDPNWTAAIIFSLAIVQIVVHVVGFLHLDTRSEGGWTLLAFLFTMVITVLTIGGSIWVMYHLNTNMMPMPGGATMPVR
jgi:cytochrome o ubiquinol oxidase operon protein cyoD